MFFSFVLIDSQTISYAQIVSGNSNDSSGSEVYATDTQANPPTEFAAATICPYIQSIITRADGTISCKYGERCPYQHGDLCEICGLYCLHPADQNQRKQHEKVHTQQFCDKISTYFSKMQLRLNWFFLFVFELGMYVNNGKRYGAFICGGTFKRQNMWHMFRGDNRKSIEE